MTLLLQFRLWWRRGGAGERAAASIAALLAIALVAWVLLPTQAGEQEGDVVQTAGSNGVAGVGEAEAPSSAPGPAAGSPSETASGSAGASSGASTDAPATSGSGAGSAAAPGGSSPAAAPRGAASQRTASSCLPTPAGSASITAKTIRLAVPVLDLAGPIGNSAAGQAPADDLIRIASTVIADINARGGVQCRTLTAKFYKFNPINPDGGRASCLQVIQDRPALVVDLGGFAFPQSAYLCVPQQKIPILTNSSVLASEVAEFAPYLATPSPDATTMMRNAAFGLRDRGFFDPAKGFKKLGLLFDECSTEVNRALDGYLAKVGITGASKFTFPCPPNGFGSPTDMASAAAQHRRDGVTHVIPLTGSGSFNRYVDAAEAQRYRPAYAVTDYQGLPITAASNLKPNGDNFHGAVAMSLYTFGVNTTPGFTVDDTTRRCQQLIVKAGLSPDDVFKGGGGACNGLWDAEAAMRHTRSLAPDGILLGLFGAGTLRHAYPTPEVTFRAPRKLHGGDSWWPIQYDKACACWHPLERNRRPSYPA